MATSDNWKWIAFLAALGAGGFYLSTRPFGALRGLVRLSSKKPAVGLTWWLTTSQKDTNWREYVKDFDFCTVKVTDKTRALGDKELGAVVEACKAAGTPIQSWSYNYARSNEEARAEGIAAASEALRIGARAHWINCEHQWAGGYMGEAGAPDPVATMQALVESFRSAAPGIPVIFNSTTSWMSRRLSPETDRAIASMFDAYGPMLYSSGSTGGIKTMRKKWRRGWDIAKEVGIPFCPMMGSGRMDKKGQFWTNLPALAELNAEMPADWITFWIAPSGSDRLYASNALNPSLVEFKGMV